MIHKEYKIIYQTHLRNFQSEIFMQKENLTRNLKIQEFKINNIFSKSSQEKIISRKKNQWNNLLINFMGNLLIRIDRQFNKKKKLLFKGMKN